MYASGIKSSSPLIPFFFRSSVSGSNLLSPCGNIIESELKKVRVLPERRLCGYTMSNLRTGLHDGAIQYGGGS